MTEWQKLFNAFITHMKISSKFFFLLVFSIFLHVPILFVGGFLDVCALIISWLYAYLLTLKIHKKENYGRICPETNRSGIRTGRCLKNLFIYVS